MPKVAGEVYDQELWLRCPMCGDSQNRAHIAHFSINLLTGAYFCVRCRSGGYLKPGQFIDLYAKLPQDTIHRILSGGGNRVPGLVIDQDRLSPSALGRFSLIERQTYTDSNDVQWDAFPTKDARTGDTIGWYLRGPDKRSLVSGEKGLGWSYSGPVTSTSRFPARLVEGPYDVIDPADVCCYGTISVDSLKLLGPGHVLILCPDSDVWRDTELLRQFYRVLQASRKAGSRLPYVSAVEILPKDTDPDEMPVSLRLSVEAVKVYHQLKPIMEA